MVSSSDEERKFVFPTAFLHKRTGDGCVFDHICSDEIFSCADVSFRMISFRCRGYITFYHPKLNFISVEVTAMK